MNYELPLQWLNLNTKCRRLIKLDQYAGEVTTVNKCIIGELLSLFAKYAYYAYGNDMDGIEEDS